MSTKTHWESVYSSKTPDQVGWFELHLRASLELISKTGISKAARIIDVGGGASTLVDDLLSEGFERLTVLDVSRIALALVRSRVGKDASKVQWLEGDIRSMDLPSAHYDLWHDRAAFHFLTNAKDRTIYTEKMRSALKPSGHIIIGTFSLEAPPICSGLDVERYSPEQLHKELGADLQFREHRYERHLTPTGVEQMYIYCWFQAKN